MFLSHGQRINWCSGNILEGLIVLSINVIKTIFSDLFLSSSVVDKVNTRSQTRHDWRKTASLQGSNQAAALARQSAAKRIDPSQVLYAYDQFWSEMLVLLVFFVKKGPKSVNLMFIINRFHSTLPQKSTLTQKFSWNQLFSKNVGLTEKMSIFP